jgi:hypothetical protein
MVAEKTYQLSMNLSGNPDVHANVNFLRVNSEL